MSSTAKLTAEQIENLAKEIREFLLEHGLWQDVDIYFNGKRFTQHDPVTGKYYYNDREHLIEEEKFKILERTVAEIAGDWKEAEDE